MSDIIIFAIGVIVFLITVYGTVVAGGLALTERQIEDDPLLEPSEPGVLPVPGNY
ncbi:MAG TPA: hypothetical protein VMY16_16000 [Ilumatobacteraceae bacterium]|nr:hypothetical protein [Ilumatobacteraceae bacterium]